MKTFTSFTIEKEGTEIHIHFNGHKDCTCGVGYTTWGHCEENELGYWHTCPICESTSIIRK